jgi:predicted MFS family arabinose efflux permease
MNLALFKNRNYVLAASISALYGAALFGGMFAVPLFLQSIQGLSATTAGLALLPAGLILAIVFPICGHLSDRLPPHGMIMVGMLLLAYASLVMVQADPFTSFFTICWWLVISRVGMAMVMPSLNLAAFSTLPRSQLTQASGNINFVRQLGGALGVNLTSVYLDRNTSAHLDYIVSAQDAANTQTTHMIEALIPSLHSIGVEEAYQVPLAGYILSSELYKQALTLGFQDTFFYTGLLLAIAMIPAYMLRDTTRGEAIDRS